LKSFNFYEFVGIFIPGVLFLFISGILWPSSSISNYLLPTSVGASLIFLVVAYASGHILQAFGNCFESLYWYFWKGMPTDWAFTKPERIKQPKLVDQAKNFISYSGDVSDVKTWRRIFNEARTKINDISKNTRIQVFNGNYGMFRGLSTVWIIFLFFAWSSEINILIVYIALLILFVVSLFRMHRFAVYYSREMFHLIIQHSKNGHTTI